jgi:hypothetical protein
MGKEIIAHKEAHEHPIINGTLKEPTKDHKW